MCSMGVAGFREPVGRAAGEAPLLGIAEALDVGPLLAFGAALPFGPLLGSASRTVGASAMASAAARTRAADRRDRLPSDPGRR
jgi:hypothetical protein